MSRSSNNPSVAIALRKMFRMRYAGVHMFSIILSEPNAMINLLIFYYTKPMILVQRIGGATDLLNDLRRYRTDTSNNISW